VVEHGDLLIPTLSTVGLDGQPSSRMLLLKHFDANGFVFFTNLQSRKSREVAQNANVSLLFWWLPMSRQVVIQGTAERVAAAEALAHFATRPRGSQLGAWASNQSSVISSRSLLEAKWEEMKNKFAAGEVPLPSFWGWLSRAPDRPRFAPPQASAALRHFFRPHPPTSSSPLPFQWSVLLRTFLAH
jgi:pyridoxamine 5'-phosphate oxidase